VLGIVRTDSFSNSSGIGAAPYIRYLKPLKSVLAARGCCTTICKAAGTMNMWVAPASIASSTPTGVNSACTRLRTPLATAMLTSPVPPICAHGMATSMQSVGS